MTANPQRLHDDAADVKHRLKQSVEALCAELLPDGRKNGNYWIARNPNRNDTHPGSFWVWISGERAGAFTDAATGDKGDVFGLIGFVLRVEFKDAIDWARNWLGLETGPRRVRPAPVPRDPEAEARAASEREAERSRKADSVVRQFKAAKVRKFSDSPADLYLLGRAIDVRVLGKQPGVLGWLPDCLHTETGTRWPAMVAAFQRSDYTVCALHKTFLAPCGPLYDKADVVPVRKIWPSYDGAVMRVWRGASGWREDRCADAGLLETLVLTEGVEDALTMALADPKNRVWAVGSLGNLGKITLPACAERVIVCQDNDWGKPQAARLFREALARLATQDGPAGRRELLVTRSPVGKDANDALRGKGHMSKHSRGEVLQ